MSWCEKIIRLPPIAATSAYLAVIALSTLLMEAFPIGSFFAWIAFAFAAFLSFAVIFGWVAALHALAIQRLPNDPDRRRREQGLFQSAVAWTLIWCTIVSVAPQLPAGFFAAAILPTLFAAYFFLRAIWATTAALLEFEKSDEAFWTFVQIAYFPLGVWFLQIRLRGLLSAPHPASSLT